MKKTVILILSVLMLFTSCSEFVNETQSPVDPNVFYLDSLPEIGKFKAFDSGENAPFDFVPSDSYEEIIPYIGSYRIFETPAVDGENFSAEQGYASYGFMTRDGRVIMKASDKNTYLNYSLTNDGFGFYTLTREVMPKDDAPDEFTPSEAYIIPRDGSWCLMLSGNSWVSSFGGGSICVCVYPVGDEEEVKTQIYGYDGKLKTTVEGVDSVGRVSSGLMLVSSWKNNGYEAYFADESGNKVLGPYSYAIDFNDNGITCVEDKNGAYLINTDGKRLTEYYESFYNEYSADMTKHVFSGRTFANRQKCDVFSEKGELIGTTEGSSYASFKFPDDGRLLYYYTHYDTNEKGHTIYDSERMIWRYVDTGEDFVSDEGFVPNSYMCTDKCFIHIDEQNKKAYLIASDGKTMGVLDNVTEVVNVSPYGEYVIYIEGEYSYDTETGKPLGDTRKTHIYSKEKKSIIFSTDTYSNAYFPADNERFVLVMHYDGMDMYDMFGGEPEYSLFDTQKGEVVLEDCEYINVFNLGDKMFFNVSKGNTVLVLDEEMNVLRKAYYE